MKGRRFHGPLSEFCPGNWVKLLRILGLQDSKFWSEKARENKPPSLEEVESLKLRIKNLESQVSELQIQTKPRTLRVFSARKPRWSKYKGFNREELARFGYPEDEIERMLEDMREAAYRDPEEAEK